MVRYAIGCMTGTSLDGLDAALVEAEGKGLDLRVRTAGYVSAGLGDLVDGLRAAATGAPINAGEFARLALDFGGLHARVLGDMLDGAGVEPAVCVLPGQTIVHKPPVSLQLINPWPVARRLGCPVLYDLRGADLAAGGQGAPITPIADWVLFRSEDEDRAIVNLGGFCNITTLPAASRPDGVRGSDVCACNQVLDACARRALGKAYDEDGRAALAGRPDDEAVGTLRDILRAQSSGDRSLGTGDECGAWVDRYDSLDGRDLLASAAHAVGTVIGERARSEGVAVLAGGGVRNAALVRSIEAAAGACRFTDALGVGAHQREATCIAVLGLLALDNVVYTQRAITGRREDLVAEGAWIGVRP
ncbi:MAG: anhydro-N-acetylmuramic acid kinase [Phycisphaerales bacterium]|jgi:anhydro-N-acetylmuramic acid kinase